MLLNQNNAVAFYGRRPVVLTPQLSGQSIQLGNTAGLTKTIAQVYMPGAVGTQLVGTLVDKLADKIGQVLLVAYPTLGNILYAIVDFINWCVAPTGAYMEAMAQGVVTYLPTEAADAVMAYLNDNKTDLALEAFKDTVYARLKRMTPYPGASAKSIKEGRDAILVTLLQFICDGLGVGNNADRFANLIAKKAKDAGATDWQIGAAVGYGTAVGLKQKGFPKDFSFQIPYTDKQVKLNMGADSETLMTSVPSEVSKWLSKLATPVPTDLNDTKAVTAWIEKQFKEKSGEDRSVGGGGGGALPLLAAAALALFASKR